MIKAQIHPPQAPLLPAFMRHFNIGGQQQALGVLRQVARCFASLPYENLTKIIKLSVEGCAQRARRGPAEVLDDHIRLGTGGTCFSLTAACQQLITELGFEAYPLLADRRYGQDTHCGLLVRIDGRCHLLDPGYLITDPVPLPTDAEKTLETSFNDVILEPLSAGRRLRLYTVSQGRKTRRLTYKTEPADEARFTAAWEQSFDWDMMRYPLLTRVQMNRQYYLQGNHFRLRDRQTTQDSACKRDELAGHIVRHFGIDRSVALRAMRILKQQGELSG